MIALWTSSRPAAAAARHALTPLALLYRSAAGVHAAMRRRGARRLPRPAIGVGSLLVGGAGKTPVAAWVAARLAERGAAPAVLLRGYGGDEAAVLAAQAPGAIVVTHPDRHRAAAAAVGAGADVLVLDDNVQHRRVIPDQQLLLFSAELLGPALATLPAGPWREPWRSGRADVVVLTVKSAHPPAVAAAIARLRSAYPAAPLAVARFCIAGWRRLHGAGGANLDGHRVFAVSGIADPAAFEAMVADAARIRGAWRGRDHARYDPGRVGRLAHAAESAGVDYVVTTAKDAGKLRPLWPADAPPVLVADLQLAWESGEEHLHQALNRCTAPETGSPLRAAAGTAAGTA